MTDSLEEIHGARILICSPDGAVIRGEHEALDLVGETYGQDVTWVALPVARLTDDFFRLRTRVAGDIVQKFVNYRLRVAIVGDITHHLEVGEALRDFVRESNRGSHLWFVPDIDALRARLEPA